MKNIKKNGIIFGAVAITLLMISSATAAPTVNSGPFNNSQKQLEKIDQDKLFSSLGLCPNDFDWVMRLVKLQDIQDAINYLTDTLWNDEEFNEFAYDAGASPADQEYNTNLKEQLYAFIHNLEGLNWSARRHNYSEDLLFQKFADDFYWFYYNPHVQEMFDNDPDYARISSSVKQEILHMYNIKDDGSLYKGNDLYDLLLNVCYALFKINYWAIGEGFMGSLWGDHEKSVGARMTKWLCVLLIIVPCMGYLWEKGSFVDTYFSFIIACASIPFGLCEALILYAKEHWGNILGPVVVVIARLAEVAGLLLGCAFGIIVGPLIAILKGKLGGVSAQELRDMMRQIIGEASDQAWDWYENKVKSKSKLVEEYLATPALILAVIYEKIMKKLVALKLLLLNRRPSPTLDLR